MKKGLLSLLVVALTVVGCQDYDDQFDSLNKEILALKADLSTITGLQTSVTAISTEITKLMTQGSATDVELAKVLTDIGLVKAAVAAIPAPADVSGINTEVADLNTEIETILEKLTKLAAITGGTYTGNINITNAVQLTAAEDIIDTTEDGPLMTITGNVNIDADNTETSTETVRINAILAKLKVVSGSVTITGIDTALVANELLYVTGSLNAEGTTSLGLAKLNTVDGAVHFDLGGAIAYPLLSSAGSVEISETSTVTSLNLSGLSSGQVFTAAGVLILANATTVDVGGLPATVTCAKATSFNSHAVTSLTTSTITLAAATSIIIKAAKITGGTVTIVANLADITLEATEMTSGTGSTVDISAKSITADKVTKIDLATLSATTISLAALVSVSEDGELVHKGPAAFTSATLTTLSGDFESTTATSFIAPLLATTTGVIDLKNGAVVVSVKAIGDTATPTNDITDYATITNLTLAAQTGTLSITTLTTLAELNFTGDGGAAQFVNTLTILAGNASLTTLNIGATSELATLTLNGSVLKNVSTAGKIIGLHVNANLALETLTLGHTFPGNDQTIAQSIIVTGNTDPLFTTLDMSTVQKVKRVEVTGNTSISTIIPPGITEMATKNASITVIMHGNLTTGTYSPSVSNENGDIAAIVTSAEISAFKTFIDAHVAQASRTTTVTYLMDVDQIDNDQDGAFDDGDLETNITADTGNPATGKINIAPELALF